MPDENRITPSILRSGVMLAEIAATSTVDAVALRKRIAELEAALRNCPREPFGLLADNDGFRDRVLAWHERFIEWQFDLPILSKPKA